MPTIKDDLNSTPRPAKSATAGCVDIGKTCWMSDQECPQCGSTLNTNGRHYWCSYTKCTYGLDGERVTADVVTLDTWTAQLKR